MIELELLLPEENVLPEYWVTSLIQNICVADDISKSLAVMPTDDYIIDGGPTSPKRKLIVFMPKNYGKGDSCQLMIVFNLKTGTGDLHGMLCDLVF